MMDGSGSATAPETHHHMRQFSEFCEQLHEIRQKFHRWDSCERTVALYYLMVGLPFANARFLQHTLEQCIGSVVNTPEAQQLERNANNSSFIARFLLEQRANALSQLLAHLPLLRPGNKEAAHCYLMTIRRVLGDFVAPAPPTFKLYNECVEVMSYVFIHPAFDKEDKRSFRHLLKQVLQRTNSSSSTATAPVTNSGSSANSSGTEANIAAQESSDESSSSPNPSLLIKGRSNSLTPHWTVTTDEDSSGLGTGASAPISTLLLTSSSATVGVIQKPRSYSLSSEKSLGLGGAAGAAATAHLHSSSSETRLQDLQLLSNLPVMKSIMAWLKSLRLHKYSWVFNSLTYKQMLELDEEKLQAIGITKGARCKLLLSIAKLKERNALLADLEADVMNGGGGGVCDLTAALKTLKSILQSPLQVTAGEDLPAQFVKVMGKVCTQLLMVRQPSEENLVLFSTLCERVETLDAFSDDQKRRLAMWKNQLAKANAVQHACSINSSNNSVTTTSNALASSKLPSVVTTPLPRGSVWQQQPQLKLTFGNHRISTSCDQKSSSYPSVVKNGPFISGGGTHSSIGGAATSTAVVPIKNNLGVIGSGMTPTTNLHRHSVDGILGVAGKRDYFGMSSVCGDSRNTLATMPTTTTTSTTQFHVRFKESAHFGGVSSASPNFDFMTNAAGPTASSSSSSSSGMNMNINLNNNNNNSTNQVLLKNIDIENSLESLCLQMMEHALGP